MLRVAVRGADDLYNLTLLPSDPRVATLRPTLDADRIGSAHLSVTQTLAQTLALTL